MSRLLNKPLKSFAWYALIILAASIPVYYIAIDAIWTAELDEHNQIIRERIAHGGSSLKMSETELSKTLKAWQSIQPGTNLTKAAPGTEVADRIYEVSKISPYEHDMDRFRGLSSYVRINGQLYHLTVETNLEEAEETLLAIGLITFVFFLILIGGFILLNRRIARNSWKPFYQTLDKLKGFDLQTANEITFSATDIAEFKELNLELTRLIDRNIQTFTQQKSFIENASHELQTPIAILQTKVDRLLQSEELTEEQSEVITAIVNNLSRMSRINKNLLLLAKIENNQFDDLIISNVSEVLTDAVELLSDYFESKGMQVDLRVTDFEVEVNLSLLEVLLNNLLINAFFHGQSGDIVLVVSGANSLSFSNAGSSPLDERKLFQRFSVSSSETTRSGLGLAISQEICRKYAWELSYVFQNGRHVFTVNF